MSVAEPVRCVDDFVPDEGLDASFLDDSKDIKDAKSTDLATLSDRLAHSYIQPISNGFILSDL